MSLTIIPAFPFPNVPNLPGVPQLARSSLFPPSLAPTIATPAAPQDLAATANQTAAWGIFDKDLNQVLTADSVLDFDSRNEWRVANFPIQAGAFASYNKVTMPPETVVRLAKGGGVGERSQFLADINTIAASLDLYTIDARAQLPVRECDALRTDASGRRWCIFRRGRSIFHSNSTGAAAVFDDCRCDTERARSRSRAARQSGESAAQRSSAVDAL